MADISYVYICSPYRGDTERNIAFAREMCRRAYLNGYEPIAPHLYYPQWLDDNNPAEREYGLKRGLELIMLCAELWICGDWRESRGCNMEYGYAKAKGMPIKFITG